MIHLYGSFNCFLKHLSLASMEYMIQYFFEQTGNFYWIIVVKINSNVEQIKNQSIKVSKLMLFNYPFEQSLCTNNE